MFMSYRIYYEDELPTGKKCSHLSLIGNYKWDSDIPHAVHHMLLLLLLTLCEHSVRSQ